MAAQPGRVPAAVLGLQVSSHQLPSADSRSGEGKRRRTRPITGLQPAPLGATTCGSRSLPGSRGVAPPGEAADGIDTGRGGVNDDGAPPTAGEAAPLALPPAAASAGAEVLELGGRT
mmetsp:Transcript_43804/g.99421  ORF Transcript_43804/g.99421 Transcript_43804/m.99421 type:complete len:117 (-) Transcript_43804:1074-1424(-)